jgi:acyl-CoA synthetase (NDP forming)
METRRIIENVRKSGRTFLTEVESKELLAVRGIPVVSCRVARDEEETVRMAHECGFPIVLKVNSPYIIHKSEHKGVFLNLGGEQSVREAFRSIRRNCAAVDPEASVTVQPMIKKGVEVLIGVIADRQFGPVVAFGLGGVFTEVLKDVVFRMAPVSTEEAEKMVYQIRGNRLLRGYLLFWHYFHTMTAMVVTLALGVLLGLLLRTVAAKKIYKPAVKSPSDSEA